MKPIHLRASGSGMNFTKFLGAASALSEEGGYDLTHPDSTVAGTSGGALVMSMLASGLKMSRAKELTLQFMPPIPNVVRVPWFPLSWVMKMGMDDGSGIEEVLRQYLSPKFRSTKIPLAVFTTNMTKGVSVEWSTTATPDADLPARVVDSMRLPLVFTPRILKGEYHRDGGLMRNFPIDFKFPNQKENVDTIGLYFKGGAGGQDRQIKSAVDDLFGCIELMLAATTAEHIEDAHYANTIVLNPGNGLDFGKSKDSAVKDFEDGYKTVVSFLKKRGK
jgi:predicted acylesterase/phospholipase RssA